MGGAPFPGKGGTQGRKDGGLRTEPPWEGRRTRAGAAPRGARTGGQGNEATGEGT